MGMRLGVSFGVAALLLLTLPVQAEYRLNCRLVDPSSPDYKRYCVGDLRHFDLVKQCSDQRVCTIKAQNFRTAYANQAASSQVADKSSNGSLIGASDSTTGNVAGGALSGASSSVTGTTTAGGSLIGGAVSGIQSAVGDLAR